MRTVRTAILLFGALGTLAAEVTNLSGTWHLNPKRSEWGKRSAPDTITLVVEHKEPKLKYKGTTQMPEHTPTTFEFDGVIDGKEHPVKVDHDQLKIKFTRKNEAVVDSVMFGPDGKPMQEASTTLSSDGKTMVRKVTTNTADGQKVSWTEIYERH